MNAIFFFFLKLIDECNLNNKINETEAVHNKKVEVRSHRYVKAKGCPLSKRLSTLSTCLKDSVAASGSFGQPWE